ncbi:hypothetical protein GT347_03275 [Xylophilus rhododendri]|uniref:Uncharacterized protein n=1 Tax=Xylophilus rhododendri TaxID=2697032 RepID=A0A857IZQ5_9BURK|nr:hypothetical protein [Xylophilus rhododendri]QHI97090.1 hypothetical protein GT347_03275 [Xylophilus rhododendri]
MTVEYLVNIGAAQLYFDGDRIRLRPAERNAGTQLEPVHFVLNKEENPLLQTNWDIGLAEFSEDQRRLGQLWKRDR